MNARKVFSLFLAIVLAMTTFTLPVFASADKQKGAKLTVNNANFFYSSPGNRGNSNGKKNNFKFSDSNEVSWATKAIEKMGAEGILSGNNGQFKPKQNVTQLEALAMILNLTGNKAAANKLDNTRNPLYKGARASWGMGYIFLAIEKKILLPEELKGFNPNAQVKRYEVAKYLVRALGKTDDALSHMDETLDYKDAGAIPDDAVGYVYVAEELGLMKGDNNNNFQPTKPITRAEMAVILDNAGDGTAIPDIIAKKTTVTFVSYSSSTDKITVKQGTKTYTYTVLEDAPVYMDSKYSSLDALQEGDTLELIFNMDKQVIFIEVKKHADDSDSNNDTSLGSEVTATAVAYSSLPQVIQDKVDTLKTDVNYKAYKYNNYIYLIATRGEKNTGGYDINIENVYKYYEGSSDYALNVVTSTDDPAPTDIVTQAITYPYDVVRINYFSGIDSVKFLDKDNDKLAETTISQQYDEESVNGVIKSLTSSNQTVEVLKSTGGTTKYIIADDTPVTVNGKTADFSDLEVNMQIALTLENSNVTSVDADDTLNTITGTLTGISISTNKTITVKTGSSYKNYTLTSDTIIYIDDVEKEIGDLKINNDIALKLVNGILTEISQ